MNNIKIINLSRITSEGEVETLLFKDGINFITGKPNTGKTVWLKMLDYLLGDRGKVEEAFGEDEILVDKYIALIGIFEINEIEYTVERKWKEKGLKSKIILDGKNLSAEEFSNELLTLLQIPILKIPKGNPYTNTWPDLSFRTLYRHIYRQERFWNDIADKQPEADQFASIAQFLGIAKLVFPQELTTIVHKNKELIKLQAQKDQFEIVLDRITRNMTSGNDDSFINFVSKKEINNSINILEQEIVKNLKERELLIHNIIINKKESDEIFVEKKLASERAELLPIREELELDINRNFQQIKRLEELKLRLDSEIDKLKRTKISSLISDIQVSHCPACDQEVKHKLAKDDTSCFLCEQEIRDMDIVSDRVEFEIKQLMTERREMAELIQNNTNSLEKLSAEYKKINDKITLLERELKPLRSTVAIYTDESLSRLDANRGRLEEKIENYKRIQKNIELKEELTKKIDQLTKDIKKISSKAVNETFEIDYSNLSSIIEDGMMEYINEITKNDQSRWSQNRIKVFLSDNKINFVIGNTKWSALSATLKAYFLLAYHYTLLKISLEEKFNYPGLLIVDFPVQFGDKTTMINSLNYLVEPFIKLSSDMEEKIQIIFSGRSFVGLNDINENTLEVIWK